MKQQKLRSTDCYTAEDMAITPAAPVPPPSPNLDLCTCPGLHLAQGCRIWTFMNM